MGKLRRPEKSRLVRSRALAEKEGLTLASPHSSMAIGPPLYFPSLVLDFLFYEMGRGNGIP